MKKILIILSRLLASQKETLLKTYVFWLWLSHSIRLKTFGSFSAVNPLIQGGGMFFDRKTDIYKLLPIKYVPKTLLVKAGRDFNLILSDIKKVQLSFPLFVKPNVGFRGLFAQKVISPDELKKYLCRFRKKEFLIQEFISLKKEYSLMYYS